MTNQQAAPMYLRATALDRTYRTSEKKDPVVFTSTWIAIFLPVLLRVILTPAHLQGDLSTPMTPTTPQ
jgi:hypothetical protein